MILEFLSPTLREVVGRIEVLRRWRLMGRRSVTECGSMSRRQVGLENATLALI